MLQSWGLLLALVAGAGSWQLAQTDRHETETRPERPAAVESEGNPDARLRYEWLRLRDPATGRIPDRIREKEIAFGGRLPAREGLLRPGKAENLTVTTWVPRGPSNVGGRTRAFAVDLNDPSVLLAGGVSGGMWRSTDGGESWTRVTLSSQLFSVSCIVQDPRPGKRHIWYYGTGELIGNSTAAPGTAFRGDGIFKSVDNGLSWSALPFTSTNIPQRFDQLFDYVHGLAVDPVAASDVVYAATIGGIMRSSDGGGTWTLALGGIQNGPRYTDVAVTPGGVVYAALSENDINNGPGATPHGVWRSADGVTWTDITPPGWPPTPRRMVLGIAPTDERIMYVLGQTPGSGYITDYAGSTEANSLWKYRYIAGNGAGAGGEWEDRSAGLPALGGPVGDFASQGGYDLVVRVSPASDSTVFIGGTNLYRSTNGFRDRTTLRWIGGYSPSNDVSQYAAHHPDQHALVFAPGSATVLYSSHDGGVSKTLNAEASTVVWTSLNNNYITGQFYTVALDHGTPGSSVIVGGLQDNGTWATLKPSVGSPWIPLLGGDGAYCAVADGGAVYYASFQEGVIYRLTLNDVTGQPTSFARVDPGGPPGSYLFIHPFALDPANSSIMYLPYGQSLYRNSNLIAIPAGQGGGTSVNWTLLSGVQAGGTISSVGVSRSAPAHRVYAGTTNGRVFRLDNADTVEAGPAATDVGTGKGFPAGGYVSCIAVDPRDGNRAIVVFSNYSVQSLFLTTDGGVSWTAVGGNLEEQPDGTGSGPSVRYAAILPQGTGMQVFAGTSTGLYSTSALNGSATVWARESHDVIGNAVVDMIDVRGSDGMVVAATHGAGVFSGVVSTAVAGSAAEEGPTAFALEQNYPNPFNPATTIPFTLDREAEVELSLYSVEGRDVATLLHQHMTPGRHTVQWTPGGLASGVYICRLKAGTQVASRRIHYLK